MFLKNKTALVTGASKGVGTGIALKLARLSANIAVNFNSDEAGVMEIVRQMKAKIYEHGGRIIPIGSG